MRKQIRISQDVKYSFETFIGLYKEKNKDKDLKEDYGSVLWLAISLIKNVDINWLEISKVTQISNFEGINTTINFGENTLEYMENLSCNFKEIFNTKRITMPMLTNMILTAAINEIV